MFKSTLNYLFKTKQFLDEPEIDSSSAVENIPAIKISDEIKAKGIELYKGRTGKDIALQEFGDKFDEKLFNPLDYAIARRIAVDTSLW